MLLAIALGCASLLALASRCEAQPLHNFKCFSHAPAVAQAAPQLSSFKCFAAAVSPAGAAERPFVVFYSPESFGCPACVEVKAYLESHKAELPFRPVYRKQDGYTSYPVVHWNDSRGQGVLIPYPGWDAFLAKWKATQKPQHMATR